MKKNRIVGIIYFVGMLILIALATTTKADSPGNYTYNAWENYYYHYGQHFDNFFSKPRVLYYAPNQATHENASFNGRARNSLS